MRNLTSILILTLITLLALCLQSCSVGMALSGNKPRDTSTFYHGSDRSFVHAKTGLPDSSFQDEEGRWIDTYLIVTGDEPSAGRAIGHGALDVVTLGLWEVIGTPIEAVAGSEEYQSFIIHYDKDNKIERVERYDKEPTAFDNEAIINR